MNQYERANAVHKVEGYYFLAHPRTKPQDEFQKAKAECLFHLRAQITQIESLTFPQYAQELKWKVGTTQTDTPSTNNVAQGEPT